MIDGIDQDRPSRSVTCFRTPPAFRFEGKRADGGTTFGRVLAGGPGWTFTEAIDIAKRTMRPAFPPGAPGRASYSDTNDQLLGAIIEAVTGDSYQASLEVGIFGPLGREQTYLFSNAAVDRYPSVSTMLLDTTPLHIQASVGPRRDRFDRARQHAVPARAPWRRTVSPRRCCRHAT